MADTCQPIAADFSRKPSVKPDKAPQKAGCCGFLGGKKKRSTVQKTTFDQVIMLLRHSERRDYVDKTWKDSEEGLAWPFDAPLTDRGHQLAEEVAKEIEELHKTANFVAIATSPYRRCLETTAAVAKLLKIPVIVDQELGEVWGKEMPQEPNPFKLGADLRTFIESIGMKDNNPTVDGGIKLFGKPGHWPETLEAAKTRYLVRMETYIEESMKSKKNYLLVTHADAVAAGLQMFERGNVDVQNLDFCARLTAKRTISLADCERNSAIYGQKWSITTAGVAQELFVADKAMEKYYEKQHMDNVEEKAEAAAKRKANRTKTDAVFADSLKAMAADIPESDEEEDEEDDAKRTSQNSKAPDRV